MIADPHCHTIASDGMVTPQELVDAAVGAHLDLIAVTDHDTMNSVQQAQRHGEERGLIVVAGQEITTKAPAQTHVLGWFLSRPIRRAMTLADTVDAIHEQGGLVIIPHPFMPTYFASIQPGMLRRLIEKHSIDGIEMEFTAPIGARRKELLKNFYAENRERLGAPVGGSDCHFGAHDIAQVVTRYDGDFRASLLQKTTTPERLRGGAKAPAGLLVRQQWRAVVELPFRRLRRQI